MKGTVMIGKNIKKIREEQGYTQESLSRISGVGEKYLSAIESGHRQAGKQTIAKLCDALMVDEQILRFGLPSPVPTSHDLFAIEQELADLSPDELLEVRVLLRKWKRENRQTV